MLLSLLAEQKVYVSSEVPTVQGTQLVSINVSSWFGVLTEKAAEHGRINTL